MPETITSIGNNAFSNSTLESIIIPKSVGTIADQAFKDCQKLTNVIIESKAIFQNIVEQNAQGYLVANATIINVEASIIDSDGLTSAYLDSEAFTKAKSQDGKYYVYTRV